MKGKSYLPRLIAFYGKMVEVDLDEERKQMVFVLT